MSRIFPSLRHSSPAAAAARLCHSTATTTIAPSTRNAGVNTTAKHYRVEEWAWTLQSNGRHSGDNAGRAASATARKRRQQPASIEHVFIASLVAAGTCRQHQRKHYYSTDSSSTRKEAMTMSDGEPDFTRQELDDLVEHYDHASYPHEKRWWKRKTKADLKAVSKPHHLPLAPRLMLTPDQEQLPPPPRIAPPPPPPPNAVIAESFGPELDEQFRKFEEMLRTPRRELDLDVLWRAYQELPSSHVSEWLARKTKRIKRLLHHFGLVESWNQPAAQQHYFQLIQDLEDASIKPDQFHWTTAISFAGRWSRKTGPEQVKLAIETWMRMEDRGHAADHVVFNILFDTAVRAGRFALADTIHNEMMSREMPLDRSFRASLIHYAGMKRDGDAVRKAFREAVQAGEIIDTTIMNAVILSFIRAGEPASAEHVFMKMKKLHEDKMSAKSPRHWLEKRELRKVLNKTAQELRDIKKRHESSFFGASFASDDRREKVQRLSPIEPNATTYATLIQYHTYTSSNADRIWELLDEMLANDLKVPTLTLVHILRGFRTHGGYAFSAWSHHRLEHLWRAMTGPPDSTRRLVIGQPDMASTTRLAPLNMDQLNQQQSGKADDDMSYKSAPQNDVHGGLFHPSTLEDSSSASLDGSSSTSLDGSSLSDMPFKSDQGLTSVGSADIPAVHGNLYEHDESLSVLDAMHSDSDPYSMGARKVVAEKPDLSSSLIELNPISRPTGLESVPSSAQNAPAISTTVAVSDAQVPMLEAKADAPVAPPASSTNHNDNSAKSFSRTFEMKLNPEWSGSYVGNVTGTEGVDQNPFGVKQSIASPPPELLEPKEIPVTPNGVQTSEPMAASPNAVFSGEESSAAQQPKLSRRPFELKLNPQWEVFQPMSPEDPPPQKVPSKGTSAARKTVNPDYDLYDALPIYRRPFHPPNDDKLDGAASSDENHSKTFPGTASKPYTGYIDINPELALAAVRAFYQCCGKKRMLEIWDEILEKWVSATDDERARVANEVERMMRHAEIYKGVEK